MSTGRTGARTRRLVATVVAAAIVAPAAAMAQPAPGTPEYVLRDAKNMADAYGRQTAEGGQLDGSDYLTALIEQSTAKGLEQLGEQLERANRPSLTPGNAFPGWNVGNPHRGDWDGGQQVPVTFTDRYGALLRGDVWAPLPDARDPYTGDPLNGPYPGVVITTGSVQGSEGMYRWLAQDLAERGYVVLTYDVQGQGRSETLPHGGADPDLPFCDPLADPEPDEATGCPGVPFQQEANFVKGTEDATDFFVSTPDDPYANPAAGSTQVDAYNPLWDLFDRTPDGQTATPGRTTRLAIVGHSLGAAAVSKVQATDDRVAAVVALDKLSGAPPIVPAVPALALQAEYGFQVNPYFLMGCGSITPCPISPASRPDPRREAKTGFEPWSKAGVDTMLIVPRASTHLDWTDIPLVLPASRNGQSLSSVYVQAWLDKYLKHRPEADAVLLGSEHRYLEPAAGGDRREVTLDRDEPFRSTSAPATTSTEPTARRPSTRTSRESAAAEDVYGSNEGKARSSSG